jgi:hypothetical protein
MLPRILFITQLRLPSSCDGGPDAYCWQQNTLKLVEASHSDFPGYLGVGGSAGTAAEWRVLFSGTDGVQWLLWTCCNGACDHYSMW